MPAYSCIEVGFASPQGMYKCAKLPENCNNLYLSIFSTASRKPTNNHSNNFTSTQILITSSNLTHNKTPKATIL